MVTYHFYCFFFQTVLGREHSGKVKKKKIHRVCLRAKCDRSSSRTGGCFFSKQCLVENIQEKFKKKFIEYVLERSVIYRLAGPAVSNLFSLLV